ncbi:protein phosphatase 1 regulatory subunit 36-like isoform X2 [Mercenaria mercenaria]|uniref:protein phosphatase 1 regulatory subunit 36-like isoform X2 n=1 Tax=Mercenaria mercenaria TaxID=6596 RepID=UPI00234F20B9|nr:protein phosphatase 1 regulatory subunit 36-like isoform X2 [Mercenaria mercenaria]
MTSVATPDYEQPLIPASGRFIWKEDATGKGVLEWSSNNPNADRDRRRRKGNDGNKRNDRVSSSVAKNQPSKARGRGNHPKSPRPPIKPTDSHNTVTLDDIKSVALDMLSEVSDISETFEGMYGTEQFDNFLRHLLTYFGCFFEKLHQEHKQNISTYIEPSLSEKQAYADSLVKLQAAEKYLGRAYCVLVLGLGLEEQHHMSCGLSRVSSTDKDRAMFETLYSFCTFVVWITFRRKDFEAVRKEVGRMLRSDTFNPAIRVKNAPEEKETEKKDEKSGEGKKEIKVEKKITPAEYRRLHPKRPAIKSIIHQRSPAIVAILPSPKEEAHWLFKTRNLLGKVDHENEDEEEDPNKTIFMIDKRNFKIGILGDFLSQYNPVTLSPMGAENEDEDNEGEEGEQKPADDTATEKPQTERGMSRTQTAVSEAVTDAFTED